jgi:hypothetical protein
MGAFNSDEYAWKDVKIVIAGKPVTGIRGIKFGIERTVTHIFAGGSNAHSRTKGNKIPSGEIKLLQSEAEALLEAAQQLHGPDADITDISFDVTVAFAASPTSRIKTHSLQTCDVTKLEHAMEQNDSNMEVTLPIMIGRIKYNV